jgi:hypothetical protein
VSALEIAALPALSFCGNALVRGRLACNHRRQREIGCPAQKSSSRRPFPRPVRRAWHHELTHKAAAFIGGLVLLVRCIVLRCSH